MRFITRFLKKLGYCNVKEPVVRLFNQGMVRDENGEVMSKSKGNAMDPHQLIEEVGVDAARLAMLFFGPPDSDIDWKEENIKGSTRFLNRVYENFYEKAKRKDIELDENDRKKPLYKAIERTTKKVTDDIERFSYNTAIAALMEVLNEISNYKDNDDKLYQYIIRRFTILLAPFAPHIAEEIYSKYGYNNSIFLEKWPEYDPQGLKEERFTLVIQVNGKVRAKIDAKKGIDKEESLKIALANENVKNFLKDTPKKVIYIPNKLINLVE